MLPHRGATSATLPPHRPLLQARGAHELAAAQGQQEGRAPHQPGLGEVGAPLAKPCNQAQRAQHAYARRRPPRCHAAPKPTQHPAKPRSWDDDAVFDAAAAGSYDSSCPTPPGGASAGSLTLCRQASLSNTQSFVFNACGLTVRCAAADGVPPLANPSSCIAPHHSARVRRQGLLASPVGSCRALGTAITPQNPHPTPPLFQVKQGLFEVEQGIFRVTPCVYCAPDNSAVVALTGHLLNLQVRVVVESNAHAAAAISHALRMQRTCSSKQLNLCWAPLLPHHNTVKAPFPHTQSHTPGARAALPLARRHAQARQLRRRRRQQRRPGPQRAAAALAGCARRRGGARRRQPRAAGVD